MTERTIYIYQTDMTGQDLLALDVPHYVIERIVSAITDRPEIINMVFHDRKSGNFYKAVYSI